MTYNAVSHIYSVVNSSDQTTNLNLGTQKTLSVIHNHIPSNFVNNPEVNSNSTPRLRNRGTTAPYYDKVKFIRSQISQFWSWWCSFPT